jgi:hypothetical protein
VIQTTKGLVDENILVRIDGGIDNNNERTSWIEWYLGDELVRRDVHVTIKEGQVHVLEQESM